MMTPLFAEAFFSSLNRRFRNAPSLSDGWPFLLILAIVIGIVVFLFYREKNRTKTIAPANSPEGLFVELCRAHHLTERQQAILWRVAHEQKLSHPALIFLDEGALARKRLDSPEFAPEIDVLVDKLYETDGPA